MSPNFYTFDWPQEDLQFIKEYLDSLDFNGEFVSWIDDVDPSCTPSECLDTNHWTFEAKHDKALFYRCHKWYNHPNSWYDKIRPFINKMARERIEECKDKEDLIIRESALHLYPENDGFMGWHTNQDVPCWRIFIAYTEEENKSYISYYDEEAKEEVRSYDKKGFTLRAFKIEEAPNLLRHSVFCQTKRWSLGFRLYEHLDEGDPFGRPPFNPKSRKNET